MYTDKERRNRVVALVLALVLIGSAVLGLLATLQASAAQAAPIETTVGVPAMRPVVLPQHATLVSVVPANGATLDHEPARVELTFDDTVTPGLAKVVLTRDGQPVALAPPTVDGMRVVAAVTGPTEPGAYRVAWQVVSDDGHPVSGESGFVVAAGAAAARPRPVPTYKTPQMQPTTFGHPDHLPGLIVAGVLLLGGAALLVFEQRRRHRLTSPDGPSEGPAEPSEGDRTSQDHRIS